jgi:hypothetical protein
MEFLRRRREIPKKDESALEKPEYLKKLESLAGKEVTVSYIQPNKNFPEKSSNPSKFCIEKGILRFPSSSRDYFYLDRLTKTEKGDEYYRHHMINFDGDFPTVGGRYAVRSIEDSDGNIVYDNPDVPFGSEIEDKTRSK